MNKKDEISISVIKRLPRYYRFLTELTAKHITKISSRELAETMGITASQIRQDLNCFGGFGQQGYGYNVEALQKEIASILGLDKKHKTILIGAGNLGRAMATHIEFDDKGFSLIGIFDKNEKIINKKINGVLVCHTDSLVDFCLKNKPEVAILCISKESAKKIAAVLIETGINAFWNFSHYDLLMDYPTVSVENVHLGDTLMTLSYKIGAKDKPIKTSLN